jgi:hypothetical protein
MAAACIWKFPPAEGSSGDSSTDLTERKSA